MVRMSLACLVLLALTVSARAADTKKEAEGAKKLAQDIAKATLAGDYAKVIDATYDPVLKLMGGRDNALKATTQVMKQLKDLGMTIKSYEVGTPGELYTEGENTFVVLPTKMEVTMPDGKIITKGFLLGISTDKGKTWKFVDSAGMKDKNLTDKVLPKMPAELKLPKLQEPEVIKN